MIRRCLIVLILLPVSLLAQQDETGNWMMYFGTNRISDQFSVHTEVQYRNHTFGITDTEQLLLRTGLNYHFHKNAIATAGYAFIPSYAFESEQKKPESTEHRIWQQFISTSKLGRVKLEHRYRIEQRWVNSDYRNRLRYRLMLFLPLNRPNIEKGSLFLGLYDEIFLNTKETFFDRNRLYGALGYQIRENIGVQAGILHQQVNDFGKWNFQFALVFNTDFRNKEKENN